MRNSIFLLPAFAVSALAYPGPVNKRHDKDATPVPFPGNCEWSYQGCWNDPVNGRILRNVRYYDDGMTVEKCLARCEDYNYSLIENQR